MRKKKNSILRRIIAAASALVMAATLVVPTTTVSAASTLNTSADVSLTITKYEGSSVGTGSSLTGTTADAPQSGTTLADVTFTVVEVANLEQTTSTSGSVELTYVLTQAGINLLFSSESGSLIAGTSTKTASELQSALAAVINAGSLDSVTWTNYTTAVSGTTGSDGTITFASDATGSQVSLNGGQGLYLVVETAAPATVTTKAVPVLVSLPMSYDGNWNYNVYIYPKNKTDAADVDKEITKVDGTNVDSSNTSGNAEASVGSVITYEVPVTAVVPADGLTKLGITDTMSAGLTFNESSVDVKNAGGTSLTKSTDNGSSGDYIVDVTNNSDGTTTVKIYFTTSYLATLNSNRTTDPTPKFTFTYTATLNANAVAGETGTGNEVKLTYDYNNNPGSEVETGTAGADVYSWGIDVTKMGESGASLENVTFVLSSSNSTSDALKFAKDGTTGVYTLDAAGGSTTLTTDSNGKITIKGLKSGTYYLIETATNSGYTLLTDSIVIVITGNETDGSATATVDGKSVTLSSDGSSLNALVPITVVNSKSFNLPLTGAAGTAMFAIIGVLFVAAAGALVMLKKKRA